MAVNPLAQFRVNSLNCTVFRAATSNPNDWSTKTATLFPTLLNATLTQLSDNISWTSIFTLAFYFQVIP